MSDTPNDELRLRATEAQMRRALGLNDQPSTLGHAPPTASTGAGLGQPLRRRFARDGDVAVTLFIGIMTMVPGGTSSARRGRL